MIDPHLSSNLFKAPATINFRNASAALILVDDGHYLMQLRDDKPGIFYPDHWGLFGGAIEEGEDAEEALRRELKEELGYDTASVTFFTSMDFGFDSIGAQRATRVFFEVRMKAEDVPRLVLTEGSAVEAISVGELLMERRIVPYDSFAIWMHHCWLGRTFSAEAPASN